MMKRPTQIIGKLLTQTQGLNDFDVYVQDSEGEPIVILSNALVRHILERDYYEWSMFSIKGSLSEQYSYLLLAFHRYCEEMASSFQKLYEALSASYDPIADYRRKETTDYKLSHETEYGKTSTNTAEDYESRTDYNSDVGDEVSTDGTPASLRDHTRTTKGGYDTTTLNGKMTTELSGTDTVTDTRKAADNVKLIEGNNRSPQEAIRDEIELRMGDDFGDIIIKGFASRYLFLLPTE